MRWFRSSTHVWPTRFACWPPNGRLRLTHFTLIAGGGSGAVHAAGVAAELGIRRVLSPPNPGAFSALGLLCTDVMHDYVQSEVRILASLDMDHMQRIFDDLQQRARTELQQEGFDVDSTTTSFTRELDVRYAGQGFELRVPVADGVLEEAEKARVRARFNELHRRQRGHSAEAEPIEVVSYRLRAEVQVPQYQPRPTVDPPVAQPAAVARAGDRRASFGRNRTPLVTPIWRREHLVSGNVLHGPAIVEQVDATTVIPPAWTGELDAYGNLILVHGGDW